MGAVCEKGPGQNAVIAADELNPFATAFQKKERVLLKETWDTIQDPKQLVGQVFLEVLEVDPEVKTVFGVQRVPKAQLLKMPRLGGHVARFTDHIDNVVTMLGFMDNPLGAWQSVRKVGRAHGGKSMVSSLMEKKNYFHIVASHFLTRALPYMTGAIHEKAGAPGVIVSSEKKAVRFAPAYAPAQIEAVWERFVSVLVTEMTASARSEAVRQTNQHALAAVAPHQAAEDEARRRAKRLERDSGGTCSESTNREEQIAFVELGDRVEDN